MLQYKNRTSKRVLDEMVFYSLCGSPRVDIIHLYIPYYHTGPLDGARGKKIEKCGKGKGGEDAGCGGWWDWKDEREEGR